MPAELPVEASRPAAEKLRSAARPARLAWIDNLRTFIIVLVVNMHACVTYSHVGSWYINEPPEPGMAVKIPFIYWQGHLQAFFMGLLFFVAGVFAHGSLTRRGPVAFLRERFVRLGLPALFYMLVINPFMLLLLLRGPHWAGGSELVREYWNYLVSGRVLRGSGPLWFAIALLVFSILLALLHLFQRRKSDIEAAAGWNEPPAPASIVFFGLILVVTTFLVRIVQPIGTSFFNFQFCFFPQYIAAFLVGVAAGRNGWLDALARSNMARGLGWTGLIGGPILLSILLFFGASSGDFTPLLGGAQWTALGFAFWEQISGLLIGLGLICLFRRHCDVAGPFTRWASDRAFGVYVLHAPVLVLLTFALRPLHPDPFTGMVLLTLSGGIVSFLVAGWVRRVPFVSRLL